MTQFEYEEWKKEWEKYSAAEDMHHPTKLRMGQHFCNHFNLTNPDLYYENNPDLCLIKIWTLVGN
jgi:23S rRNA maturation-related 3'-5' exoribonuclease YhaM